MTRKACKIMMAVVIIGLIANAIMAQASYADDSMHETLERDGKLRLIVKFKGFIADRISFKMGDKDLVVDDELNEYILQKIDQKYNLKKLARLFNEKQLVKVSGEHAADLDDYFVLEIDKDEKYAEWIAQRLEKFFEVDMAEEDMKVEIAAVPLPQVAYIPNDTYVTADNSTWREGAWGQSYPNMWGLQKTQTFEAWDLYGSPRTDPGKNVIVAVIDTGVDFAHPDIAANKWVNPDEVAANGVDDDGNGYIDDMNGWSFVSNNNNPYDAHGHGTHVSGTIAAVTNNATGVAGIAPNARIMALKGLSDSGYGYISWLSNCVIYAANNGAHILSNSWGGGGSSSTLTSAMNYAHSKGCVITAAAGNSNTNVSGFMPANIATVIAVAATDYNDVKAYFSNYGAKVEVSAPGVSILSSTGGGYASWSGTSMACPHASGVAALILSHEPALTNEEVRQRLKETTDDISAKNPSYTGMLGTGRINAYKAISAGRPQNRAPVLAAINNKSVNEGEELRFTVSATDEEGDPLTYSMQLLPQSRTIEYNFETGAMPAGFTTGGNGTFYVASGTVHAGTYALKADPAIVDNQSEYVQTSVTTLSSGQVSFWWKVSSEYYYDFLEFYVDGALQAYISGEVDWQKKTFALSAGTHILKWRYMKDYSVTTGQDTGWVDDITISGVEGGANNLPAEAVFNAGTRTFTWTPTYDQAGTYTGLRFIVTEETPEAKSDYEDIAITVNDMNRPPVLDPIGDKTINEMELLTFAISATDPENDTLSYSASGLPTGATFDSDTRTFTWTPTYDQAGVYNNVRFTVSDGAQSGASAMSDTGGMLATDTKLLLHLNGSDGARSTIDSSSSPHTLNLYGSSQLDDSNKKWGATSLLLDGKNSAISSPSNPDWDIVSSGADSWTIDMWVRHNGDVNGYEYYMSSWSNDTIAWNIYHRRYANEGVTFNAANGVYLVSNTMLNDNNWHHIAVVKAAAKYGLYIDGIEKAYQETNSAASLIGDLYIGAYPAGIPSFGGEFEGNMDEVRIIHANPFGASPDSGLTNTITVPAGEYTGDEGDSSPPEPAPPSGNSVYEEITITVNNVNRAPALSPIGNKSVDEGVKLEFTVGATDPDNDTLAYTATNLPDGASFNSTTGLFAWTPAYDQSRRYSNITFTASDGGLIDSEAISITVNNANAAPVLAAIGNKSVDENKLLEFTISATDGNNDTLTYTAANLPSGATFNSNTRTFTWTPAYTDAGSYSVTFTVTDGALTDSEDVTITVQNINRKPVITGLAPTPAYTIAEGQDITITINASDPDGDTITYNVENNPEGSGFVNNDFYWAPGYDQSGGYPGITFTVFDGALYSDPSDPVTITVTNAKDAPSFIIEPTLLASYNIAGAAKDVAIKDSYAYTAYGLNGLKVLNVAAINNISAVDAINAFTNLTRLNIQDDYAYAIDTGALISILNMSTPSAPAARGDIIEPAGLDIAVNAGTAYVATGSDIGIYDITDIDNPVKIEGHSLGKAKKVLSKDDSIFAISEDEDLKIIDASTKELIATKTEPSLNGSLTADLAVCGDSAYVAKEKDGIIRFDISDLTEPAKDGTFVKGAMSILHVDDYTKDRIYIIAYDQALDTYSLLYINTTDPASMSEIWSYGFSQGVTINNIYADGNKPYVANENGLDIIATPLESAYTVEAGDELKITIYAKDPDNESISYTMNNKPDFNEAIFTDNADGTALFRWIPTEDQIGTYQDITFTASDAYQEATSGGITITITQKEVNTIPIDENTRLLLHTDGVDGSSLFTDSSSARHAISPAGSSQIDTSIKKWGTGSLMMKQPLSYLRLDPSSDWNICGSSSDDWTMDFWARHDSVAGCQSYIGQTESGSTAYWEIIHVEDTGIRFLMIDVVRGVKITTGYAGKIQDTNWHHVALCKVGSKYAIYLDGQQVNYTNDTDTRTFTNDLTIGYTMYDNFNGYMDEIRVQRSNIFDASPDAALTDTITVPTGASR